MLTDSTHISLGDYYMQDPSSQFQVNRDELCTGHLKIDMM